MSEKVADVGDEGEAAGTPKPVGEGCCNGAPDGRVGDVGGEDGATQGAIGVEQAFGFGESGTCEKEQREVDRKGVVLLIGGSGEEEQDQGAEEAQQKSCSLRKRESSQRKPAFTEGTASKVEFMEHTCYAQCDEKDRGVS